jgi:hypothetical protein
LKAEDESTIINRDSSSFNTSRNASRGRKNTSNRFSPSNISSSIPQEQTSQKSRTKTTIGDNLERSKISLDKAHNHSSTKAISQKVVSEVNSPKSGKNLILERKDDNMNKNSRRYLPEVLSVKNNKQRNVNTTRTSGRKSIQLWNEKSNPKEEDIELLAFDEVATVFKSRSDRRNQSPILNAAKRVKSVSSSSIRSFKAKIDDSNKYNLTTRSDKNNQPDKRLKKTIVQSGSKQDIAASGSESVRINIPLSFDNTRKLSNPTLLDNVTPFTETPKRSNVSRSQERMRHTDKDKKTSRGSLGRGGVPYNTSEVTNESVFIRGRSRNDSSKKTNTIVEIKRTSSQPDSNRRNLKSVSSNSGNSRNPEVKDQNHNNEKSNRSRGRQRVNATSIAISNQATTTSPNSEITHKNRIISRIAATSTITTTLPATIAPLVITRTSLKSKSSEAQILNLETNKKDTSVDGSLQQNVSQRRRASKEDFFNHGLGFRGRRPPISGVQQGETRIC